MAPGSGFGRRPGRSRFQMVARARPNQSQEVPVLEMPVHQLWDWPQVWDTQMKFLFKKLQPLVHKILEEQEHEDTMKLAKNVTGMLISRMHNNELSRLLGDHDALTQRVSLALRT